jgi:hypothetical protein
MKIGVVSSGIVGLSNAFMLAYHGFRCVPGLFLTCVGMSAPNKVQRFRQPAGSPDMGPACGAPRIMADVGLLAIAGLEST